MGDKINAAEFALVMLSSGTEMGRDYGATLEIENFWVASATSLKSSQ